ncbi:MAG: exodeoxyribonuclease VII large subunit [Pseudomonadota bacterium]|nr:exodeoxyribonuclease VII large subunit [Pseudomonadota bacterium]
MAALFDDPAPERRDGPSGPGNLPELSVSDLSGAVKKAIEDGFGRVRVRGEVGRVSRPRSGHIYLDLKDDRAVLAAIVWKGQAGRLQVQPTEGDEVVATGRLTTFPGQSRYQLIVEDMALAGMGALLAKLERLKKTLEAEGLFAPERKRPLPYLPRVIGVVTSPSGAVIRDILHRLADRFPVQVLVWPVAVQGERCAAEVSAAIRGFNALSPDGPVPRPDVLIVARGGGSVEDLWGFNEEVVVRAAADSRIPLISAVGHETDTTLIDYASDRRAPTPTAAAELAVPVRAELRAALAGFEERRSRAMARMLEDRGRRLRDLARLLPRPDALLSDQTQRLDRLAERLPRALAGFATVKRAGYERKAGRFSPDLLARLIERRRADLARLRLRPGRLQAETGRGRDALARLAARLDRAGAQGLEARRQRLDRAGRLLESFSYQNVLDRGFAVVRMDGAVATRGGPIPDGARVEIEFADARRAAVIDGAPSVPPEAGSEPAPKPKPARKPRAAPKKPSQGDLFG